MNKDATRETNITTAVNDFEYEVFEKLGDVYDCSKAGANRLIAWETYRNFFGDIHPAALDRPDVDTEALIRGELDPEDVPDEYKMDGDGPAQVPVSDGGVASRSTPSSYTPTYTPQDLSQAGTELTWTELKESVERHWNDDLEIHEDRVRTGGQVDVAPDGTYDHDEYALRASQTTVAKILMGLLRSKGGVVPETLVEGMILKYTDHQINRANTDAGKRYKKETYKELLVDELGYLIPHPDPLRDEYYTSEEAAAELFATEVEETIADLVDKTWVLDPREHVQQTGIAVKEDATQWLEDLADFRQKLGFLQAITSDETWSDRLEEMERSIGDFPNARVAAAKMYNELLQEYVRVNQWARFAVANAKLDLEDGDVLTDEVSTGDDWKQINADRPSQPVVKWVTQCETPLSPEAQIAAVSEKL
ncbi:hypothetical protein [Natronorubrum sp. FCH18a]|uniref:hypothetical protein n=1 Tax=Natronorubrum sp. FCH18a TaxID=3447018 RepID=UPI003F516397